jgi:hypothetical protein
MNLSMTGQVKGDLLCANDCLIEVTAWVGLTIHSLLVSEYLHICKNDNQIQYDKYQ